MSTPVDEFLEVQKTAFGGLGGTVKNLGRQMGQSALSGGATALGMAGAAGVAVGASKLYSAITKKRDFDAMMEANPHLQEQQEKDPEGFNRMFTSLRSMAPEFSADPLVAGSYMFTAMVHSPEDRGALVVKALRERPGAQSFGPVGTSALKGFEQRFGGGMGQSPEKKQKRYPQDY